MDRKLEEGRICIGIVTRLDNCLYSNIINYLLAVNTFLKNIPWSLAPVYASLRPVFYHVPKFPVFRLLRDIVFEKDTFNDTHQ